MYWISIVILIPTTIFGQTSDHNYGPYKLDFLKYETCKGPKRGECGSVIIDNVRNMSDILFILDIPKDCHVKNAKIAVGTFQNNKTKILWNHQLNKPCQHFVLGPIITKSFNINNNCNIIKGHYEIHINMYEITRKFLGSNFFYDSYYFKNMAFNDANNFFCILTAVKISKT